MRKTDKLLVSLFFYNYLSLKIDINPALSPDSQKILIVLNNPEPEALFPHQTLLYDRERKLLKNVFGPVGDIVWLDSQKIFITGSPFLAREGEKYTGIYELNLNDFTYSRIDAEIPAENCFCAFSPDMQTIVYATLPKDDFPFLTLGAWSMEHKKGVLLGSFFAPFNKLMKNYKLYKKWVWSSNGEYFLFNSTHEGFYGIYRFRGEDIELALKESINQLPRVELERWYKSVKKELN